MIELTAVALAMPYITAELRPEPTEALWIGDAYAFVMAGTLITMGTLASRIGRKKPLLIGASCALLSFPAAFAPQQLYWSPRSRRCLTGMVLGALAGKIATDPSRPAA